MLVKNRTKIAVTCAVLGATIFVGVKWHSNAVIESNYLNTTSSKVVSVSAEPVKGTGTKEEVIKKVVTVEKIASDIKMKAVGKYTIVYFASNGDRMKQKEGVTAVSKDFASGTKLMIDGVGIRLIQDSSMSVPSKTIYVYSASLSGTSVKQVYELEE